MKKEGQGEEWVGKVRDLSFLDLICERNSRGCDPSGVDSAVKTKVKMTG